MKLSNYILLLFALATIYSCKSNQGLSVEDQGEVLIEQYCSGDKYFSDKNTFRGNALGESLDQMTAKKKARSNAQAELAKTISSTMKIVGDKLEYKNKNKKNSGYDIKEGRFNLETGLIGELTLQRGRKWVKKN